MMMQRTHRGITWHQPVVQIWNTLDLKSSQSTNCYDDVAHYWFNTCLDIYIFSKYVLPQASFLELIS